MTNDNDQTRLASAESSQDFAASSLSAMILEDGKSTKLKLDNLEDWFRGKLLTRLEPNAPIVVVQTRWPHDDLPKRLMSGPRGKEWTYIRAVNALLDHWLEQTTGEGSGTEDPLGRKPGEELWPRHIPAKDLLLRKHDMGGRGFEAQFMQDPIAGGSMFQPAWFENNRYATLPETFDRVVMSVDCASKTAASNDWSVVAVIGEHNNDLYLIDVARRKVAFTDLVRMVLEMYAQHQPTSVYIEDTSAGIALCQLLEESDRYLPITKIKPTLKKEVRWQFITPACEQGRLRLPKDSS